jgi:hypothetical protein
MKNIRKEVCNLVESELGINLQNIEEIGLNRLFTKHYNDGFVILTSYRNSDEKSDLDNKKDFEDLKNIVKSKGYSFIPVFGGFIENEGEPDERTVHKPALLIPNHQVGSVKPFDDDKGLYELSLELINKYNQDSFLYKPKGEDSTAHYVDKSGTIVDTFTNKTVNDLTKIYFTDLEKSFNKDSNVGKTLKRFTFSENMFLSESPKSFSEAMKRRGEQFFSI